MRIIAEMQQSLACMKQTLNDYHCILARNHRLIAETHAALHYLDEVLKDIRASMLKVAKKDIAQQAPDTPDDRWS